MQIPIDPRSIQLQNVHLISPSLNQVNSLQACYEETAGKRGIFFYTYILCPPPTAGKDHTSAYIAN